MEKTQNASPVLDKNPFLDIVHKAEKVFVEEIPSKSEARHFFVSIQKLTEDAPSTGERTSDDILENAALLLQNREYLLARHLFSAVLKKNIKEPEALHGLGICLLRLGDPTSARRCFRAMWDMFGEPKAAFWLAQCFSSEKEDLLALEWFKRLKVPALLNQADRFEYFKELGNCYFRLGDLHEADKSYRAALELQPESDAICANLGTLELQRNQLELAVAYFERALRHNPESSKAFAGMGVVAFESQDFALAARFFCKALDIDTQNQVALHQLIECAEHIEVSKEARVRMERFLEKEPQNHRVRFSLAALLYKKGLWKVCETELDLILRADPTYLNAKKLKEEMINSRKSA